MYSIYALDEYLTNVKEFYTDEFSDKFFNFYSKLDKNFNFKNNLAIAASSGILKNETISSFYSNFFYIDDSVTPLSLIQTF